MDEHGMGNGERERDRERAREKRSRAEPLGMFRIQGIGVWA